MCASRGYKTDASRRNTELAAEEEHGAILDELKEDATVQKELAKGKIQKLS